MRAGHRSHQACESGCRRLSRAWGTRGLRAQKTTVASQRTVDEDRTELLLRRRLAALLEVLTGEFSLELLDPTGGVNEALLAGVERMRAGPDLHVHLRHGGADFHDDLAAVVNLGVWVVLGMNLLFHGVDLLNRGVDILAE